MEWTPLKKSIFSVLKKEGHPLASSEIATALLEPEDRILSQLTELVEEEWLTLKEGKYWIPIYLDPPLSKEETKKEQPGVAWEWERIIDPAKVRKLEGDTVENAPYNNPWYRYLPKGWSQNGRGTCTGHMGAIISQLNYYAMTGDLPTTEEMSQAKPDQQKNIGACTLIYDIWYRTVFSAQWIYHAGRIFGNVTYPSGGYTKAVFGALVKYGAVPWDTCLTPKTPSCAPTTYPLSFEETEKEAVGHKLTGYAVVTTWEGVLDAIEKSKAHCIGMATNLEEDYRQPSGGDTWKPKVGAPKAGSHALPWVKVDRTRGSKGMIQCYNSWGDFPHTWIGIEFWRENCSPAYVPLDDNEALIGNMLYVPVKLVSNVPAKFEVKDAAGNTAWYEGTDPTVSLEKGKEYHITAIPLIPADVKEATIGETVNYQAPPPGGILRFTFTPVDAPPPPPPKPKRPAWLQALLDLLFPGKYPAE